MNSPTAFRVSSLADTPIKTQLLTFFTAVFLIAWVAWIPAFVNPSAPRLIAFIGLFAPALAALASAAIFQGQSGVQNILRRFAILSFPFRWALFATLIMPALYMAAIGLLRAFGRSGTQPLFMKSSPVFISAGFLWLLFVTSGEEIGWRGYALPLLLQRFHRPVLVSLLLGLVWGLWHLPLYLLPGQSAFPLPLFLIFTSLQSVLYTVVFLRTKGSLLLALLLHAGTDIAPRIFQIVHLPVTFWVIVDALLALLVMALLIALRQRHPKLD